MTRMSSVPKLPASLLLTGYASGFVWLFLALRWRWALGGGRFTSTLHLRMLLGGHFLLLMLPAHLLLMMLRTHLLLVMLSGHLLLMMHLLLIHPVLIHAGLIHLMLVHCILTVSGISMFSHLV